MVEELSGVDWVYFEHKDTGGHMSAPDEPGVVEFYTARGWKQVDEPVAAPFVPAKGDAPPDDSGWVQLVHSETGAEHTFPSNPEALEGAIEAGWQFPKPPPGPEPEPAPSKPKQKASTPPATDEMKED